MTRRTPTGREPSKPNLQSIPLRTETGNRVREVVAAILDGRLLPDVHAGGLDREARAAAFVAGLPEGTVIEFRAIDPKPEIDEPGAWYEFRRKSLDPR